MARKVYEALLLTVPELTADEAKSIEQNVSRLVESHKGTLISFERWGKYRLAYPIKKNEYGVYFLARFEAAEVNPLVFEVKTLLNVKLHELIMRNMITNLEAKQSLAYQRPPSLEEGSSRDVGSFFKENSRPEFVADAAGDDEDDKEIAHD